MFDKLYHYKAKVTRVVDGDTFDVSIDAGFDTHIEKRLRLHGINAYETRKTKGVTDEQKRLGIECREKLKDLLEGQEVIIRTFKDKPGKYGRLLCVVYFGEITVNDWIVENGFGCYQEY